jgi:hypothetical protein
MWRAVESGTALLLPTQPPLADLRTKAISDDIFDGFSV